MYTESNEFESHQEGAGADFLGVELWPGEVEKEEGYHC
jgi:hypothetical protein